jgi:Tol biopolymer transport system component
VSYYLRIGLCCLLTLILTAALVAFGPRSASITLAAYGPQGEAVGAGASLRLTFSRPVDRQSAEASFRIEPPAEGYFFWDEQTLTFQPKQPLLPETQYTVTVGPELQDDNGRANARALSWGFRTRGPQLLVLRAADDGASELWMAAPDGQGARQLLRSVDGISDLVAAPDGAWVVYVELRGLERSALMVLDLETGVASPLVDDVGFSAASPAWGSSGELIAFERRALTNGALGVPRLWLAQPDGWILGPLFAGDGSDISYGPSWSPDGNYLAFLDGISQELKLYSFFNDQILTLPARAGERPSWTPDGASLVYSGVDTGPEGLSLRLRLVGREEPFPVRDLTDGAAAELTPAVSPDGLRVAYTRRLPGQPESTIWLTPLDGGPGRQLSSTGAHMDTQPAWSPDGRRVAYVRSSTGGPPSSTAMVVDVAGGQEFSLLDGAVLAVWVP